VQPFVRHLVKSTNFEAGEAVRSDSDRNPSSDTCEHPFKLRLVRVVEAGEGSEAGQ
jgi:hypothetical protein